MSAHLRNKKISYFSVPKCACSSLKFFFFEVQNGFAFRPFVANGENFHVHRFFPTRRFDMQVRGAEPGFWKIAVVRDPVSRTLSAYRNRVAHHRVLERAGQNEGLDDLGLPKDPDPGLFVDNLERYIEISGEVRHHTRPLSFFLGTDPAFFDKIYPLRNLTDLVDDVNRKVGRPAVLPHKEADGPKMDRSVLTPAQIDKIEALYAEDFRLFGRFF